MRGHRLHRGAAYGHRAKPDHRRAAKTARDILSGGQICVAVAFLELLSRWQPASFDSSDHKGTQEKWIVIAAKAKNDKMNRMVKVLLCLAKYVKKTPRRPDG
jgi:hypothetical protein